MHKITILIGVAGLIAFGWFVIQGSSIDHVATVDDELSKLERELAALDVGQISAADAASAQDKISARLSTINASLSASHNRVLSGGQQQTLVSSLNRLQDILLAYQSALTALDQTTGEETVTPDNATIASLTDTIVAIQDYLDIPPTRGATSSQNATYRIDGQLVTLVDGFAESEVVSDSAARVVTKYFGNEVTTDLNGDGRADEVFVLTQSTGGTGTFFYVVAALNTVNGWEGSAGYLLGDRISPQTTELSQNPNHQNVIVVNYIDRAADQPMSEEPSVGMSVWLKLDTATMTFGEVAQDFEGEVDPARMTLTMQPWRWVQTTYGDGTELVPAQPEAFVLTFSDNNTVSIATDCNTMGGTYEVNENQITFSALVATKMFCEDSQEQAFADMLTEIQSYFFTTTGELVFDLTFDSGSSVFR